MLRLLCVPVLLLSASLVISKELPPKWWLISEPDPFAALLEELGDAVPDRLRHPPAEKSASSSAPPQSTPGTGGGGGISGGGFAASSSSAASVQSLPQPPLAATDRLFPRPPRPGPTRPPTRPRPLPASRPAATSAYPPPPPSLLDTNSLNVASDPFQRQPPFTPSPIIFPDHTQSPELVQRIPSRQKGVECTCVPAGTCGGAQKEIVGSCGVGQVCCAGEYRPKCGRIIHKPPMHKHEVRDSGAPWTAALLEAVPDGIIFACGGALVHPQVVLTAARCIDKLGSRVGSLVVRLGERDLLSGSEPFPHQQIQVQHILVHQNYSRVHKFNDLALLFLQEAAELRPGLDTVCVRRRRDTSAPAGRCAVQSFGLHPPGVQNFDLTLREAAQTPLPAAQCVSAVRTRNPAFQLHASFTCTDSDMTCDLGEDRAGSPLTCSDPSSGEHRLTGLVAWAVGCRELSSPGIYTDVERFYEWIDYHVTDFFGYIESYFGFNQV